jgi:hypothetical protein
MIMDKVSVDLDGDGHKEDVFCAVSRIGLGSMTSVRAGDWSCVLLLGIDPADTSRERITELQFDTYGAKESAAPTEYHIAGCYDLNGDGRMELLVSWKYYEGNGVDVFALKDRRWQRVAGWGCGI